MVPAEFCENVEELCKPKGLKVPKEPADWNALEKELKRTVFPNIKAWNFFKIDDTDKDFFKMEVETSIKKLNSAAPPSPIVKFNATPNSLNMSKQNT